jgi:hypothetical protein
MVFRFTPVTASSTLCYDGSYQFGCPDPPKVVERQSYWMVVFIGGGLTLAFVVWFCVKCRSDPVPEAEDISDEEKARRKKKRKAEKAAKKAAEAAAANGDDVHVIELQPVLMSRPDTSPALVRATSIGSPLNRQQSMGPPLPGSAAKYTPL